MKTTLYFSLIAFIFSSCEDVIDVDLNSIEPKLVVEGLINIDNKNSNVKLTKTTDYFNPGEYENISEATVVLTDESGFYYELSEFTSGQYSNNNLHFDNITTFRLSINSEGNDYSVEIHLPEKVEILSTSFEPTPDYMEFSGGCLVNCHLRDPAGKANFYRYNVYTTNEMGAIEEKFNVFDDEFVDGNEITMRWEEKQFFPGDTVVVELRSIDEGSYDYYLSVNALLESGFVGSATPANPTTNISGGALGYFGASTVSRDTIIVAPN